jgi:hypothetical protein
MDGIAHLRRMSCRGMQREVEDELVKLWGGCVGVMNFLITIVSENCTFVRKDTTVSIED